MRTVDFFNLVWSEYKDARKKYASFHSTHEGIAVIQEEVDELWDMVKRNKEVKIQPEMVKECIQIAAMSFAFMKDLGGIDDEL